jgi:twitching motility protein PilI
MARKSALNLHAYQQDILDRLKRAQEAAGEASSSRLGVRVGDKNCLLSMNDIAEALPVPQVTVIPHTREWFLGMANVRGVLYGISDLAALNGGGLSRATRDSRILLAHSRFGMNVAFLISQLAGLRNIEEMLPLKDVIPEAPWLSRQYRDTQGQEWVEVDVRMLLNQQEFLQVAA